MKKILLALSLIFSIFTVGQVDSVLSLVPEETVSLDEMSFRTAEAYLEIQELGSQMVNRQALKKIRLENDSLLDFIDERLVKEQDTPFESLKPRVIKNKLKVWDYYLKIIKTESERLKDAEADLDKIGEKLSNELALWESVLQQAEVEGESTELKSAIIELITEIKKQKQRVDHKRTFIITLHNRTSALYIEIEKLISELSESVLKVKKNLFHIDQPVIYKIRFPKISIGVFIGVIKDFVNEEVIYLKQYFSLNKGAFVWVLFLYGIFIFLFKKTSRNWTKFELSKGNFFLQSLDKAISRPFSTAMLLTLLCAAFIFQDGPLILSDIIRFLWIVPLINLLSYFLENRYKKLLYTLILLLLIYELSFMLPPNGAYLRLLYFVIGGLELWVLTLVSRNVSQDLIDFKGIRRGLLWFVRILNMIAVLGFIGNVLGASSLTQIAFTAVLKIVFFSLPLGLSTIIVIGLVQVWLETDAAQKSKVIKSQKAYLKKRLTSLLIIISSVFFVIQSLRLLFLDQWVFTFFKEQFMDPWVIGSLEISFFSVISFFLIIWLSVIISRIIKMFLEDDILSKINLDKGLPHSIAVIVQYSLVVLGIVFAVSVAGLPVNNLTVVLGAFGVGIGFGLQNIFNNLVSGLILLFERPIQIGDTVEVGPHLGVVKSIGLRSSNVKTFQGAEIIIPNGDLVSKEVINWTLSDQQRRIEINVGISYGSNPREAKKILDEILNNNQQVQKIPKPQVLFGQFGESSLDFRVLAWTNNPDEWMAIKSDLTFQIFDALKKNGIEIPFPQRDIHIIPPKEKEPQSPEPDSEEDSNK